MDIRRDILGAAVRLAAVLSTVAAFVAIGIDWAGDVSATALVATVSVVGFVSSWVLTGRVSRPLPPARHHRVAVVPVRHRVG
jgi:hypothetical protein